MYYLNSEENFYRGNDNIFYSPVEGYTKGNMNDVNNKFNKSFL